MSLSITVDAASVKGVSDGFALFGEKFERGCVAGLQLWGESVMATSKRSEVPVMDGILRSTGHVTRARKVGGVWEVTLGFGGPAAAYALRVHENPRAGKTGGWGPGGPREIAFRVIRGKVRPIGAQRKKWAKVGSAKYLERPFLERSATLAAEISTEAWRRAAGGR